MERFHLALCLAELCGGGKAFADGLSIHLARQTEVWSMTGLVWLMTAAIGFSTAALDRRNRTTAEIAQRQDLGQNAGALLFESGERIGQRAPPLYPNVSIRKEQSPKKKKPAEPVRACRAPHDNPTLASSSETVGGLKLSDIGVAIAPGDPPLLI